MSVHLESSRAFRTLIAIFGLAAASPPLVPATAAAQLAGTVKARTQKRFDATLSRGR